MSDESQIQPEPIVDMAENKLRQLAIDIHEGRVFGSWNLHDNSLIPMIFMPLSFASPPSNAAIVYEYMSEAGTMGINGYPSFFSCKFATASDAEKLMQLLRQLEESRDSFLTTGDHKH